MAEEAQTEWRHFLSELEESSHELLSRLTALHDHLTSITSDLKERYSAASHWTWQPGRLASLDRIFNEHARRLLVDMLVQYERRRLDEGVFEAFQNFQTRWTDAARNLPARVEVSAASLISALPEDQPLTGGLRWSRWRNRTQVIQLRRKAVSSLEEAAWFRSDREGRIYLLFAQGTLSLLDPWQSIRERALWTMREERVPPTDFAKAFQRWTHAAERRRGEMSRVLDALRRDCDSLTRRLTSAVLRFERSERVRGQRRERRRTYQAYWGRQRRAVRALVETELNLLRLGVQSVELAQETIAAIRQERESVLEELDLAIASLRGWHAGDTSPLPPASAQLTSARDRVRVWRARLASSTRAVMPGEVESLEPRRAFPGWVAPWSTIEPQASFLECIEGATEPILAILEVIEDDHKAVLREIERAREVVTFGIQSSAEEADRSGAVAEEGVGNARSLLEHARETLADRTENMEAGVVGSNAAAFYQFHLAFEQGRVSLVSYLAREGLVRGLRRMAQWAVRASRRFGRQVRTGVGAVYHRALVAIGWEIPIESGEVPVERWQLLLETDGPDLREARLPLIYGRLFRVQPVEDPRFLVGRDSEMRALSEASDLWRSGRFAAVLVVGQRGSGKTSLLNCAAARFFAGDEVIRTSFHDRLQTADGVRSFLANQVGAPVDTLVSSLSESRRVVFIEEMERTFLRSIGGREALEEFLRIVSATSGATLWIVSVAAAAFRFLEPTVRLSNYFSHRINASAVERDQLREAILQRHHLSGLRLQLSENPDRRWIESWLHQKTGLTESTETEFFDALYRQSGGVYRAAFRLWQDLIDRSEAGVLYIHFPKTTDHSEVMRGLNRDQLFTLQMIVQHGSLTTSEHARIFSLTLEASRAQMAQLIGRGIIEPEPAAPGYRIRPRAGVAVRSALAAENLI